MTQTSSSEAPGGHTGHGGPADSGQPVSRGFPNGLSPDDAAALMREYSRGTLAERMGIEIVEASAQRTVGRMPVAGNTQPYGLLHGGASAVLAETIGSIASALHAGPDRVALGLELSCSHHRAQRDGVVTGVATPIALTRSVASYDIRITDEAGKPVCTARLTCLLRDAP
jgi:1,4-dihydroxy-2-naphthoyl-CoA hydrolase